MTREEHKAIHKDLHRALDLLVADFIAHTEKLPSRATIMELLKWSHEQTKNPTKPESSSYWDTGSESK